MLLIRNAVYLGAQVDLLLDGSVMATMTPAGRHEYAAEKDFDAHGLHLLPSLIDCHVHLREPGFEYKEDIGSGLEAAAHGGFGAVMCMANTLPVNDNSAVTTLMLSRARATHPDGPALYPIAAATLGLEGKTPSPLEELHRAGCIAVSNDGRPVKSTELVRRIMEYASDLGMVFIDHCEDPWLAEGWQMNEGQVSGLLGLKGQPAAGETIQAARDIFLAEYLNLPVHIAHVSTAQTVDLLAWAKSRGVRVTAETCPHYLVLDENAAHDYGHAKVSPPLRTSKDRDALLQAVRDGIIDILVTDHAPHAEHEVNTTWDERPCGFTGLDLALALCLDLVREGKLTEFDLQNLWARRPSEIFHIPWNSFNPGEPASLILFDPEEEWLVSRQSLYSRSANTPFLGKKVRGRVKHHWINGIQLF